jgi:hypothetical protein
VGQEQAIPLLPGQGNYLSLLKGGSDPVGGTGFIQYLLAGFFQGQKHPGDIARKLYGRNPGGQGGEGQV